MLPRHLATRSTIPVSHAHLMLMEARFAFVCLWTVLHKLALSPIRVVLMVIAQFAFAFAFACTGYCIPNHCDKCTTCNNIPDKCESIGCVCKLNQYCPSATAPINGTQATATWPVACASGACFDVAM